MTVTKEFTVLVEDRPNALGKVCRALAERGVNILALQFLYSAGKATPTLVFETRAADRTEDNRDQAVPR
jgi:acetolactate synthase small subunit